MYKMINKNVSKPHFAKTSQGRQGSKINEASTSQVKINIPVGENKILTEVLSRINSNREIKTLWRIINVNAIERLGFTDHGPMHFNIVANYGLQIARIFENKNIKFSIVKDFGLSSDHAEVVIFLGCIMHDLGMSIHRVNHEMFSLFMARDFLKDILDFMPIEEKTVVISETLHAIISHSHGSAGKTSTIEGGIVRIADALDMSKGRSRIPYQMGQIDIHSVSANAIESVTVSEGKDKPVEIKIVMTTEAGVFQVDDFIEEKLEVSGIAKYINVRSFLKEHGTERVYKDYTA
jgi:metal-dependent HD superfamily phosphatase/phosphodiesterase